MVSSVRSRPNHYEVLGLSPAASQDEIAGAFAKAMGMFGTRPVALAAQWVAGRVLRRRCRRIDTPGDLFTTGGPAPGGAFAAHRLAD